MHKYQIARLQSLVNTNNVPNPVSQGLRKQSSNMEHGNR